VLSRRSDQPQRGQRGAGGGKLRVRQFDLEMRDHVRSLGGDSVLAQRGFDRLSDSVRTAAVEMLGQRRVVDADGGGGGYGRAPSANGGVHHRFGTRTSPSLEGLRERVADRPDGDVVEIEPVRVPCLEGLEEETAPGDLEDQCIAAGGGIGLAGHGRDSGHG